MKTFSMLSLTLGIALVTGVSCSNQEGGREVPIDSTNDLGTAPAQYQSTTQGPKVDTTMQSQPYEQRARQDQANERSMQEAQQGNGNAQPPQSNTTDPKTTSGSTNNR
jgi:hypothetical protein